MRRLTLRQRLVLGIVALLTAVTIVIGVVSVFALQGFLIGRLDDQLISATDRSRNAYDKPPQGEEAPYPPDGQRPPASKFLALPGQPSGTVAAIVADGEVFNAAVLDSDGVPVALDAAAEQMLVSVEPDGRPTTVELGELGTYRVAVQEPTEGRDSLAVGLPLAGVDATIVQLAWLIAAIGLVGVVAAATAGAFVVRSAVRPLERVADTATRVSELPLDRGEVALAVRVPEADADPATEVGRVGAAFNRMLEHVASALTARQASENKVRTFVADASHELRTPLASIRGYAELTRRGGHDLPPDVVHAIGRVESESVRMTSLVEELLLLARLDEGDELDRRPVDIIRLVVDAVSDAQTVYGEHDWSVEVPDEPVEIQADAARLHQVVTNLLANAGRHTPAGTSVVARVAAHADSVVIEIADTGPGIPTELISTVFERFVRGDESRSRASGSTGLGLAIVSAIVESHGGTTGVESEPGRTIFRVSLPRDRATAAHGAR